MQKANKNIGIVILAAGESKRMGTPKQLLTFDNKMLINKAIDIAISTQLKSVVLVLGAFKVKIEANILQDEISIVENINWNEGMASSVRIGLEKLIEISPNIEGVVFMVCDQPYVTKEVIEGLINVQAETGFEAAASRYNGKIGTPALLLKSHFNALFQLKGDTGARKILLENSEKVAIVDFDAGIFDIDTPEDYQNLSNAQQI
jgi:molybdenum cofactor cytidylyltransferase